jgi:3-methyladenine DNA glycosylase/8-oxoguanine DNA glycosylase
VPPTTTYLTPPKDASLPAEAGQLEYSNRSMVFPRDGPGILRAWGDPEDPFVVRIDPAGARWRITAWGADAPTARRAVRTIFSLDDPLGEFYRAVRAEPVLRGAARRFRGLRLPRDGSLFESLVHAVIGQQLSVAVASTMESRLVSAAGATVRAGRIDVPFLPGPRRYLALPPEALDTIGLSRAKRTALDGIARQALAGAFDRPEEFRSGPREPAIERLDALPGVGRWTAENALLRGVGRRDLFLAGDLGIRVALAAYGAVPRDAPEEVARAWGDRHYPGWGSYATLYLWRTWVADGAPRPVTEDRPVAPRRSAGVPPPTAPSGSRTRRSPRRAARRRGDPAPG